MNAPARRGEDLLGMVLAVGAGLVLAVAALVWLAGQTAALLVHQTWPPAPISASPAILLRLAAHPGQPAAAWPAPARGPVPGPVAVYGMLILLLAIAVTVAVVLAGRVSAYRASRPDRDRDHSPRWARAGQVGHLLTRRDDPQRVTLGRLGGRLIAAEPRRSVLLVAPTQAGKTTRFVIPTVASWGGPMVVTSVKTDVLRHTYHHRRAVTGGAVLVFDPTDSLNGAAGFPTARWSPLLAARTYPEAEATARWLVKAAADARPETNASFWELLASKLLAPLLFAAANTAGADMGTVASWLDRREVAEVTRLLSFLEDDDAANAWTASTQRDVRTRDSAYATAEALLQAFASPTVRRATTIDADSDVVDPGWVLENNATLYLVAPAHEQERLAPVFEALVQTVIREAQRRHAATGAPLDPALLLMLDEAAHVAPLRNLATVAATGAGQGIQVCSVWQDLAQIEALYGRRARSVVNNHTARVFLPGSADFATLDELSKMLGDHEVERRSTSVDDGGRNTRSVGTHDVRLAPPNYLRTLPPGTAVVLYGRDPALRLATRPWFDDPALRGRLTAGRPPSTAAGAPLPPPRPRRPTGADRPAAPLEADMPRPSDHRSGDQQPAGAPPTAGSPAADRRTGAASAYAGGHSTVSGLTPDPADPQYAYAPDGRRYYVNQAVDGTVIARPCELNDAERAALDASRDRQASFSTALHAAARDDAIDAPAGLVIPWPLTLPPAGDP